jgi:hypothetical protein
VDRGRAIGERHPVFTDQLGRALRSPRLHEHCGRPVSRGV